MPPTASTHLTGESRYMTLGGWRCRPSRALKDLLSLQIPNKWLTGRCDLGTIPLPSSCSSNSDSEGIRVRGVHLSGVATTLGFNRK